MSLIELDLKFATFINSDGEISVNVKKEFPEKLYKYYSINEYSNSSMKNSSLFFSHAHLLNDVMDGNFSLWDLNDYILKYKKDTNNINDNSSLIDSHLLQLINPILKYRGTLSLTECYKNELFWAHYTNDRGYCIQLNTQKLNTFLNDKYSKKVLLFPISYNELEPINFHKNVIYKRLDEIINDKIVGSEQSVDAKLPICYSFSVKDKFWDYENEWRFLLNHNDFGHISNPLEIISDDLKKVENDNLKKRNIEIDKEITEKVILAVYFFNNERFNKREIDSEQNEIYWFKKNYEYDFIYSFLEILKDQYNNKIEQIDKVLNYESNLVYRELECKIEILELTKEYVKIKRSNIEDK